MNATSAVFTGGSDYEHFMERLNKQSVDMTSKPMRKQGSLSTVSI